MKHVLVVFGTRPEGIKMAPVISELRNAKDILVSVCVTGQHREMLAPVLELFELHVNYDLSVMEPNQTLSSLTANVLKGLDEVLDCALPDLVLVHGDTTTTFTTALACFYRHIPVGHVEAGLRTGNLQSPWPEEGNRVLTSALAELHFAPTETARSNLLSEGVVGDQVVVTGNTVIDALHWVIRCKLGNVAFNSDIDRRFADVIPAGHLPILVTGHRRESFDGGFERICEALLQIARRNAHVQLVYPVHLNPKVSTVISDKLSGVSNISLIPPQPYLEFCYLMERSYLVLTDSGGVQEEAPSLGKPVLVMRDTTERPEAVEAGTVKLVGTDTALIVEEVEQLLHDKKHYEAMSRAHSPYGDGNASARIVKKILQYFEVKQ